MSHLIPRRCYSDRLTPAEKAIRAAMQAVEEAGAHPLLTGAVMLLEEAFHKVADHTDAGTAEPLPPRPNYNAVREKAEREACAQVAEQERDYYNRQSTRTDLCPRAEGYNDGAYAVADRITRAIRSMA